MSEYIFSCCTEIYLFPVIQLPILSLPLIFDSVHTSLFQNLSVYLHVSALPSLQGFVSVSSLPLLWHSNTTPTFFFLLTVTLGYSQHSQDMCLHSWLTPHSPFASFHQLQTQSNIKKVLNKYIKIVLNKYL